MGDSSYCLHSPICSQLCAVSIIAYVFAWQMPQGVLLVLCLCITGMAIGGIVPILMSIPVQLPEIGTVYAGTAGGFTGTLQLLGAVIIPTYIAAPMAGENMKILFLAGGICMIFSAVCSLGLPKIKNQMNESEEK